MPFDLLPNQALKCMLEFLDLKDYLNLKLVCKQFVHAVTYYESFWARECMKSFFSFDLESFS